MYQGTHLLDKLAICELSELDKAMLDAQHQLARRYGMCWTQLALAEDLGDIRREVNASYARHFINGTGA